jgi:hypothetical protein
VPLGQDIRLALLLLLNAAVLSAAIYAVKRWTRDPLQRFIDVLLLWYLVQYLAVGLPGMLCCLSPISMSITALLLTGALTWWASRRASLPLDENRSDHTAILIGILFYVGMMGKLVVAQRLMPLTDADAITYHVPVAVQWLQSGRLNLVPLWFFNPANTYSPLAGSTFIFWLMAPLHSDALLRFVQAPAILLLLAAMIQLGRMIGVKPWPAVLCAMAATSRMVCSEVMVPGDDLLLSAFVMVAVAACGRASLQDLFGPWRIGIALALMLSTKYTALISLPMILLLWGAPQQAGWNRRQWVIAMSATLVLAGPWYLRNLLLTGNPLYPLRIELFGRTLLPGLFAMLATPRLRNLHEIRKMLVGGFHGLPIPLLTVLVIGFLAAILVAARRFREPLVRACLLGPLLCIAVFFAKAPFGEVRFLYPAIFVMFVALGLWTVKWKIPEWQQALLVAPLPLAAIATSYIHRREVWLAIPVGIALGAVGCGILWLDRKLPLWRKRFLPLALVSIVLTLGFWIYVDWDAYVGTVHVDEIPFWHGAWPDNAPGWEFAIENTPTNAVLAYSQAYFLYPLFGDDLDRRLIYVPVRADVPDYLHHPNFPKPVDGETMGRGVAAKLDFPADQAVWRKRLAASKADYLFIELDGPVKDPPELSWVSADKQHFTPLFRDQTTAIYQIHF